MVYQVMLCETPSQAVMRCVKLQCCNFDLFPDLCDRLFASRACVYFRACFRVCFCVVCWVCGVRCASNSIYHLLVVLCTYVLVPRTCTRYKYIVLCTCARIACCHGFLHQLLHYQNSRVLVHSTHVQCTSTRNLRTIRVLCTSTRYKYTMYEHLHGTRYKYTCT